MKRIIGLLSVSALLQACGETPYVAEKGANEQGHIAPSATTVSANKAVLDLLPFENTHDFDLATKGLIATPDSIEIKREDNGKVIWSQDRYEFLRGKSAPDSVNPSLWRQSQLNAINGLFKVEEGIYQLRGFDLANMTLIEGDTGWIIVDPLTTAENASFAWQFAMKHLPNKPVSAILYTHSHVDHFGGVLGIISAEQAAADGVRIIAPAGFSEEATSENVMAGLAMNRRAEYQYGNALARNERGHVGLGLGQEVPFGGQIGFLEPTETLDGDSDKLEIDGVPFEFKYAPNSEAPAEFVFWLPEHKAFCGAEVVSRTMHNVYTLRGAKVRDALSWSNHIGSFAERMDGTETYFASHHWPIWGNPEIVDFLEKQRDTYKFIHDQSLRMANAGFTPREIAEAIELPKPLAQEFFNRGYYGTIKHNAKAVYQYYFGWYDGNPANLDPLPPKPAGEKYVTAFGGADKVLALSQKAYDGAEYRWASELLNHLVFADDSNQAARQLLARVYDQMGYRAESGPWRAVYLSAAFELRHGAAAGGVNPADAIGLLAAIPVDKFFDSMAARLLPDKAEGEEISVNIVFTDLNQGAHLWVKNSVMHHRPYTGQKAAATLELTHPLFMKVATNTADLKTTLFSDDLNIKGSKLTMLKFLSMLDKPEGRFNIVTP
jgi:alkyl sulfatase BDS1-like metallo-beta-lactamase superfamily hydrolase